MSSSHISWIQYLGHATIFCQNCLIWQCDFLLSCPELLSVQSSWWTKSHGQIRWLWWKSKDGKLVKLGFFYTAFFLENCACHFGEVLWWILLTEYCLWFHQDNIWKTKPTSVSQWLIDFFTYTNYPIAFVTMRTRPLWSLAYQRQQYFKSTLVWHCERVDPFHRSSDSTVITVITVWSYMATLTYSMLEASSFDQTYKTTCFNVGSDYVKL